MDSFPLPYCPKSCDKEKLSIPLEGHHNAQSSEKFSLFRQKIERAVIFLSFGQSCWNCIFKRPSWTAFKRRTACWIMAKKSCNSHLFGVVPSRATQMDFVQELSKAITFLSYVLSWWNFTFKLSSSRAFQRCLGLGAAPKKSCTSHQFTPYANWSVTKCCFHHLGGSQSFEQGTVRYLVVGLGVGKIWRPSDLRSRSYKRLYAYTHTRTQGD